MLKSRLKTAIVGLILSIPVSAASAAELIMFEEAGCYWCGRWNTEISHIYPKTAAGEFAPLRRLDKNSELPPDLKLTGAVRFTPTFVLVDDDTEIARIEGYPGEDFFWGLLEMILTRETEFQGENS